MTPQTNKEKRAEILQQLQAFNGRDNLTEEETAEFVELTNKAGALKARITAEELLAEDQKEKEAEREREKKAAVDEAVKAERAKHRRLPEDTPYQTQFGELNRYDNLDRADLALLIDVQKTFKAQGVHYVNGDLIDVDPAAVKSLAMRVAEMKPADNTEEARKDVAYTQNAFKAATGIDPKKEVIEAAIKTSGDPNYSGGSLVGSDWVGTAYANDLWRKVRAETKVVGQIPSETIPDGYSNKTWPLESTDMTWYKVAEASGGDATLNVPAATVTSSQLATANKNITIGKMGARGVYTGEIDEDSLIRFSAQLRTQLEVSGQEILESLVIDGDTEVSASKNINTIASSPATTDYYLLFDGFRKLPLVTTTTNSVSANGSLAVEDFLDTLKTMGTAGIAGADPTKCAFIVDGNVYYTMAKLAELKTKDTYSAATIENGFVTRIWNVPVIGSWQMHHASAKRMANTAGKINGTDSSNTTGAAVAVRWDQWKLAYKRRMTLEITRIANADAYEIVALCRLGLGYRDAEASAILYNIGL